MSATYIQPYRPVSTARTATDDAIDVAQLRDTANALNNAKARVFAPTIHESWPQAAAGDNASEFKSKASSTAQIVIGHVAPIVIASGINAVLWTIGGRRHSGAAGTTTWRLIIATRRYDGEETLTETFRLGSYAVMSASISSATHAHVSASLSSGLPTLQSRNAHLLITAQNSASGASEYSWLTGMTATFIVSGTT